MRGLNEYHPLIFTPFPLDSTAKIGERRLLGKGERQLDYSCVAFENDSQFTDNVLLHMSATLRRVGITVPTNGFTVCMMHGNLGRAGADWRACKGAYIIR